LFMPAVTRLWRSIGRHYAFVDYLFKLFVGIILFVPAYGVVLNFILRKIQALNAQPQVA
ncbi:hypothetical protein AAUPMC_19604, partial [Pasteurella multocida subsp. multocida str. Anand1_cattle]